MKTIIINGKHNKDMINKVENPIREEVSRYKFDFENYNHEQQINIVNNLYLENDIEHKKEITSIISKKIQGYKSQDKQKKIWDEKGLLVKMKH